MNTKDEQNSDVQGQPTVRVLPARVLEPLPRQVKRAMLKAAIKAGKDPHAAGYEAGYEAAKKLMYEAGFRQGYSEAVAEIQKGNQAINKPSPGALVQPVEIGLVAPDGSKLVIKERDDYQPSEASAHDGGSIVVTERT